MKTKKGGLENSLSKIKRIAAKLNKHLEAGVFNEQGKEYIIPLVDRQKVNIPIKINFLEPRRLVPIPISVSFSTWKKSILNFIFICLVITVPLQAFSYYQEYSQKQEGINQVKMEINLELQEALGFLNNLDREAALQKFRTIQKNISEIKVDSSALPIVKQTTQRIILILSDTSFQNFDNKQKTLAWSNLLKEVLPRILVIKNSLKNI